MKPPTYAGRARPPSLHEAPRRASPYTAAAPAGTGQLPPMWVPPSVAIKEHAARELAKHEHDDGISAADLLEAAAAHTPLVLFW